MNIKYFSDTDTMYVQFNDHEIVETKDLSPNMLIDVDREGNAVGITIEHAKKITNIGDFSFQQVTG